MKKPLKFVAIAVGVVLALIVVAIVALPFILDPNQHKDRIIKIVKDQTGRDLKIAGDLGLSFFPSIGITAAGVELSNAPGFGPQPFARMKSAAVDVQLLPLFRKKIIVDGIRADGLELNLAKNAQGQTNWQDLIKADGRDTPAEPSAPSGALAALGVNKLNVRNTTLTWRDRQTGADYTVRNLELAANNIASAKPADVRLGFDLESGTPPMRTRADLTANVRLDVAGQTLDMPKLRLALGELVLEAQARGTKIFDAPAIAGAVTVAPFSPSTLMTKLGVSYAPADKKALAQLALKTDFSYAGDTATLNNFAVTVDETHIKGKVSVQNLAKPAYQFEVALDGIDLDRYFPQTSDQAASPPKASPQAAAAPLAALRDVNARGTLRAGKIKVMGMHAQDMALTLVADNGRVVLGPNQAKLYQGTFQGQTVLDARGAVPQWQFDTKLAGVQLGPLLKDAAVFDRFSGTGNVELKLTTRGAEINAIKRGLNGTTNVALADGKIAGVNLQKMVGDARANYDKLRGKEVEAKPQATDETTFKELTATIAITNGVAQNNDLRLVGPVVRAQGAGSADLIQETIDYRLQVTVAEDAQRTGSTVPLRIGGSFAAPKYRLDFSGALKERGEEMKEKAGKSLEKRLDEQLDKWRQKSR